MDTIQVLDFDYSNSYYFHIANLSPLLPLYYIIKPKRSILASSNQEMAGLSMETSLVGVFLFLHFFLLSSSAFSKPASNGIDWWCKKTTYPETCKYFFNHGTKSPPKDMTDFKKMVIQFAMERALSAESHTKGVGSKCRNGKEKAAWADCLKLYQNTILQLNQTLDSSTKCTEFDIQTWLSTALTNLETCRTGFAELNVLDYIWPLIMSDNVTKLISNSLAINNASAGVGNGKVTYKKGFPSWLSGGDRRLLQSASTKVDLVVAQDGSGNYTTVGAALEEAAKRKTSGRFVIQVKRGVYRENLEIGSKMKNIMLIGDGMRFTFITGNRSVGGGSTTFNSATVAVTGEGFIARGITFQNTAGPENHQAVALRSGADLSVFYRCAFEGYQDTLYVHSQRQFYKECYIYGTVDFIFGNAAVVLQNCMIYARKPMNGQKNAVTAQGRTDPNQNTGISIHNSRVMATDDLKPVESTVKTYLGRPWKEYSRTVFMKTYIDSLVDPTGWLEWDGDFALNTLYYGEYNNIGPGSPISQRVKWKGYHVISNSTEASEFTVQNFIAGQSWLPNTEVPFTPGL
ncbi:pectinesterase 2-like [Cucumis melo]|uniref:Pectinesterase n=1 Tax=Cucumis melo TaxID=3656 RepID=A0A1S3AYJ9_CUCME|nr:pectinesterase 2-like [Cucumis melo]